MRINFFCPFEVSYTPPLHFRRRGIAVFAAAAAVRCFMRGFCCRCVICINHDRGLEDEGPSLHGRQPGERRPRGVVVDGCKRGKNIVIVEGRARLVEGQPVEQVVRR